jgi:hypothetical protein
MQRIAQDRIQRDRQLRLEGEAHVQVIAQVLADAGQLVHDVDACALQHGALPDSGELE